MYIQLSPPLWVFIFLLVGQYGQVHVSNQQERPQSRQSAKLFLQSSKLGPPQPQASVLPHPLVGGREGTLACGRGVGGVPISTRGHTLWCFIYIRTLWERPTISHYFPSVVNNYRLWKAVFGVDSEIVWGLSQLLLMIRLLISCSTHCTVHSR
jgi:hypothetical protein